MEIDPSTPSGIRRTPAWLYWARGLLLIALSGSAFLAWESFHHGPVAGCGVESGCNAVLQSRWAYWLNLPVSVPAILVYVALLAFTFLLDHGSSPDEERGSWAGVIILSVAIMGSAFWFVSLQVFVIQSFCKYCLTAHLCGFAAAMILLSNVPYASEPGTPMWTAGSGKRGVPRQAMWSLMLLGLACVAGLVGGQLLGVQKERNVVKDLSAGSPGTNQILRAAGLPAEIVPASPDARLVAPRTLSLYSNQFIIKLDDVPVLGSRDASHILVCLVDYTCIHCRLLHPTLLKFSQQYSNDFGLVCLPISLCAQCNPFIPREFSHADTNSCEYARLGLAVWRAKPEVHRQFDDWLFDGVKPPSLQKTREYAAQLVGADKLNAALADPWVARQILTDCKLHRANWLAVDSSEMPQIVIGRAVSSGPINSIEHLKIILNRFMGVNLPVKGM